MEVWKIPLGLRLRYSNSPLKKLLAGRANPRSANRVNIGISSGFFSMGYESPAAAHHMPTFFSRRNLLFRSTSRSSVFAFDFFHSWLGFGRGGTPTAMTLRQI
jgi:hypothetical protein